MSYQQHPVHPPAYEIARWSEDGKTLLNAADRVKWSKDIPLPGIGTKINVKMNSLGPATVKGYFTEYGWLGLLVEFHNPPAWWIKQNGRPAPDKLGHVFAIEFEVI